MRGEHETHVYIATMALLAAVSFEGDPNRVLRTSVGEGCDYSIPSCVTVVDS